MDEISRLLLIIYKKHLVGKFRVNKFIRHFVVDRGILKTTNKKCCTFAANELPCSHSVRLLVQRIVYKQFQAVKLNELLCVLQNDYGTIPFKELLPIRLKTKKTNRGIETSFNWYNCRFRFYTSFAQLNQLNPRKATRSSVFRDSFQSTTTRKITRFL